MAPGVNVITSQAGFAELLTKGLAVIDFNATWCGPCKAIAPLFAQLPARFPNVAFASVDIDQNKAIADQFQVSVVPSFLFLSQGAEIDRVRGANVQELEAKINQHAARATQSGSDSSNENAASSSSSSSSSSESKCSYNALIPKNFEVLNDQIEKKSLEALNVTSPKEADTVEAVRAIFNPAEIMAHAVRVTNIESDADSQLLFYVPFMSNTKVHSILIQSPVVAAEEADDGGEPPKQRPVKIKVWVNLPSVLSFDDAESVPSVHDDTVPEPDSQGWSAVRLRYVRFQRVSSLVIFLDGADEDEPTGVNKILLVGEKSEKQDLSKLKAHEHDES